MHSLGASRVGGNRSTATGAMMQDVMAEIDSQGRR